MECQCFPCEHNIVASMKCTPLLMNNLVKRWNKYKRESDRCNILMLVKLSPYIELYINEQCKDINTNDHLTYSKLITMNRQDAVCLLIRNYLFSKKQLYGKSFVSCSYCEKDFCEYHCMYTEFTHFKCTGCDEFKSVCENCACEMDKKNSCCCNLSNSFTIDINNNNDNNDEDNEDEKLWREILKDLNLTPCDEPFYQQI